MSSETSPPPTDDAVALVSDEQDGDPLKDIPPLTTYPATTEEDQIEALRLIADSIAQQRQSASKALIFHPINGSLFVGLLAIITRLLYHGRRSDMMLVGTTWSGILMAGLVSVRLFTGKYLFMAEETGTWGWLGKDVEEGAEKDSVIVSVFGEEVIGALVLRLVSADEDETGGKRRSKRDRRQKGVIRAWTVKRRYRGKGIGTGLLEEAVKCALEKGCEEIEFADDHANSGRVLWPMFNGRFDRGERRGREKLKQVWVEMEGEKKGKGRSKRG